MTAQEQEHIKQVELKAIQKIQGIIKEATETIEDILEISSPIVPDLNSPVTVAGITWDSYLEPSEFCICGCQYIKKDNIYYFDQKSAILHAKIQDKIIPSIKQYQQLCIRTTQRNEMIGTVKYKVFTDNETNNELWMVYSGYYNFEKQQLCYAGLYGYCWSESVFNADYGYNLLFSNVGVNPQSNNYHRFGSSVRSIRIS